MLDLLCCPPRPALFFSSVAGQHEVFTTRWSGRRPGTFGGEKNKGSSMEGTVEARGGGIEIMYREQSTS